MRYEHLPGDRFTFGKEESYHFESDGVEVNDTERIPITDLFLNISHEKFILPLLVVIGIGKVILFAKIYHLI